MAVFNVSKIEKGEDPAISEKTTETIENPATVYPITGAIKSAELPISDAITKALMEYTEKGEYLLSPATNVGQESVIVFIDASHKEFQQYKDHPSKIMYMNPHQITSEDRDRIELASELGIECRYTVKGLHDYIKDKL